MGSKQVAPHRLWWEGGIIYQVYPRSFQDSNGDGIGDLNGICKRLDYLKSLNIEALWLSPIYPSPMKDFGYDVSDYTNINPLFGNLEDFDHLLEQVHQRGMKLLLDLVPNHTSSEHPWFKESRKSRDNPYRNFYYWRDPHPNGGPPNNWLSFFGGSAWTFDQTTGQYYLHQFLAEQPELNYNNPETFNAMMKCIRFWLDKGVDGFRVDVIWVMMKDQLFRDEPPNPAWNGLDKHQSLIHIYTQNVPGIHELIKRIRKVFDEYDERMFVGEIYINSIEELVKYYGNGDECHMPFNFNLVTREWSANSIRALVLEYERCLPKGAWPNWVLGNHDQHRIASRVGRAQARIANMLLLTLRGTPTTYYGEEIGMVNGDIPLDQLQDPFAKNNTQIAHIVGRDPERTPMQWDSTENSGFTAEGVKPWLPLSYHHDTWCNVAQQESDQYSMLHLYRAVTTLREKEPALYHGNITMINSSDPEVDSSLLCYIRTPELEDSGHSSFLVVLNLSGAPCTADLSGACANYYNGTVEISTGTQCTGNVDFSCLHLNASEGLIIRLSKAMVCA